MIADGFGSRILPLALFAAALALYISTLAPGLLWGGGDFATFQTMAYLLEIELPGGIFGHPLWVILAHPFTWLPIRDVAWRANLASAVFAAGALTLVFLTARHLTRSVPASLLATAALAVSHTFWTYAVMPKAYSLNTLLLISCIYLLLLWGKKRDGKYLCGFAFLYGLSLLNHLVMATAAAGFLAYIGIVAWQRREEPGLRKELLLMLPAWMAGVTPYLLLLTRAQATDSTLDIITGFVKGLGYVAAHPQVLLLSIGVGLVLLLSSTSSPLPLSLVFWAYGIPSARATPRPGCWG